MTRKQKNSKMDGFVIKNIKIKQKQSQIRYCKRNK